MHGDYIVIYRYIFTVEWYTDTSSLLSDIQIHLHCWVIYIYIFTVEWYTDTSSLFSDIQRQTLVHKTLHKKLRLGDMNPTKNRGWSNLTPEMSAFAVPLVVSVLLKTGYVSCTWKEGRDYTDKRNKKVYMLTKMSCST